MTKLRRRPFTKMITLAFVLSFVVGCGSNGGNDKETIKDLAKAREELKKQLHDAIEETDEKIAELEAQAAEASEDVRQQLTAAIAGLRKERQKVVDQVQEVAKASEVTWKDIKRESDEVLTSASKAYDSLVDKLEELAE